MATRRLPHRRPRRAPPRPPNQSAGRPPLATDRPPPRAGATAPPNGPKHGLRERAVLRLGRPGLPLGTLPP
eukprot:8166654-Lingulodinium_polyedra.AAC.1